jgi:RNA polymerase sigma-70 factor (ECF subfamily)
MNVAMLGVSAFAIDPGDPEVEASLVARARTGDTEAFEALYRRHVGRIHALCQRIAGSRSLAEDCTQEAFVQAWNALPRFRGESAFGSWLHRIALNVVLGQQRKALRRAAWVREDDHEALACAVAPAQEPQAALDLDRAIAQLPPGARAVFVLYDIEGYQHQEIAALTGLAVGTCKAHLHRARRLLRARLTP